MPTSCKIDEYIDRCFEFGIANSLDLEKNKTIILEWNFEELNGISFKKGCYMGQELMSRTKHVGEVRKKIFPFESTEDLSAIPLESEVMVNEEKVGVVKAVFGNRALVMLRLEKLRDLGHIESLHAKIQGIEGTVNRPKWTTEI